MPKLGMGPIRRRQLVEAAVAVIHEQGFAQATVARIARHAGVSAGMVHHYFEDKDELLFATMRHLLADLRADAVARLALAESPRQRICAIIDSCFGDRQFDERVFSAWLALYGNARHSARLMNILSVYHRRLKSSLLHDLRRLLPEAEAPRLADGIAAMIDGLWLRYALTGKPADPETPRALTRDYLAAALDRAFNQSRAGLNMPS
ncbi:transcriptional regulator BetI [Aestuariivirga sp.]|uniref:transcriptional regulator BetI n=1 Tax=Aestuariivirga sp. TaxID=2650926 RepID=UPI003BAB8EBC